MTATASTSTRFARVPERITLRLELGEITFDQYGVMVKLIAAADRRTRVVTFASIEILRLQLGWHRRGQVKSESHLRNCLRALREAGEVDFATKQGRRGDLGDAWEIRIVPDDCFIKPESCEVTSDGAKSPGPSNPDLNGNSPAPELRTLSPSCEVESEAESEGAAERAEDLQSRAAVTALIDESLQTSDLVERVLRLIPSEQIAPNTRGVIAGHIVALSSVQVDEVIRNCELAITDGRIHKGAVQYIVTALRNEAEQVSRGRSAANGHHAASGGGR